MAEEITPTGEETEGQAPEGSGSGTPPEGTAPTPQEGEGNDELARARREAAKYRTERNEAAAELKKLKDAQLTDAQKIQQARDEALGQVGALQSEMRGLRVQVAATKVGIVDPEAASALLKWDDIEDPNDPKQLERALKALAKERPWLTGTAGTGGADGGTGGESGGEVVDMNTLLRRAAGRE